MKWFMSFAHIYSHNKIALGHCVYASEEHPLDLAQRLAAADGKKYGYQVVVLSFQQVPLSMVDREVIGEAVG
jgi:hypothetical protein